VTDCSSFLKKDLCHFNAKIHHKLDLDVKAFFLCIVLAHWVLQVMLAYFVLERMAVSPRTRLALLEVLKIEKGN